ncbi:DNA (cytosine-5)-methyltransferase DRM1-like [Coffea eugenioides]|uniref:DNA (cytosine-5)-methyltransferase DRM1-like n=1 Tax=Coffea eugenioides TaxID=49369 RepID=UPI000F6113DE|nr:DNA (cytosine-5)-methyltransferase DRM1-like [Coffea eugenioides]XP_027185607.1 DNA (cytosine-5)-methyltransferase DRM1-like [Coffea eugenioides]XP_027185608.1 DNA (cytosine-5)-methyltransferase DRM1-like [Coffea eugenioides]
MESNASGDDFGDIDWNTEDELEISEIPISTSNLPTPGGVTIVCNGEESSSAHSSNSKLIQHFVGMGFPDKLVVKAIEEIGEGSSEGKILDTVLTYLELQNSSEEHGCIDSDQSTSGYDESLLHDSDIDSWSDDDDEENTDDLSESEKKLQTLQKMGYSVDEATEAMHRCGPDASIAVLTDFICAAQIARAEAPDLPAEIKPKANYTCSQNGKLKRRLYAELDNRKKQRGMVGEDSEMIRLPKPMVGFGLPTDDQSSIVRERTLPEQALGPPYFYYENVALTPKGVWDEISKCLYYVEPEFVDSKYFCAAARKRGYVHNLPIQNRFPLRPLLPLNIEETFPLTKRWWPSWDSRTYLNCLQTAIGSAKLQDRIRKAVEAYDGEPPEHVKKYVIDQCKKWNLLWVGRNKVAPLEPDEFELLLGFPRNHTRGGGISRTDRYKSLGNSFQVNTVAYHLSVLKPLFPDGINILSLFSGIGGAEVALHRLGIPLNNVVSVEKSEINRNIVRSWWEQTNQKGNLIDFDDVQTLDAYKIESLAGKIGGFDLVIGGSPCNNLAGSNRVSRDGLEGKESVLFYEYVRILDTVKNIMSGRRFN